MTEKRTCQIDNCDRPFVARGMCQTHYQSARERGDFAPRGFYPPGATCAVSDCDRRPAAAGLCTMHRRRVRRHGSTDLPSRPPWEPRFWAKVDKQTDGCWIWSASRYVRRGGYGQFNLNGTAVKAHRIAYELVKGPIPDGLVLDHLCRVTACVNPDHLEAVTQQENTRRGERGLTRSGRPCARCGCAAERHDHFRAGSDCGYCGKDTCPQYKPGKAPR